MEHNETSEGRWLTTREAHRRLGIDVRSLYRLIDEGQLPAYKLGRDLRLSEADVDAYRAEHPPPP
jgi:excisionase family DNA binding protein